MATADNNNTAQKKQPFRMVKAIIPDRTAEGYLKCEVESCNERATMAIETKNATPPKFYTYVCDKHFYELVGDY